MPRSSSLAREENQYLLQEDPDIAFGVAHPDVVTANDAEVESVTTTRVRATKQDAGKKLHDGPDDSDDEDDDSTYGSLAAGSPDRLLSPTHAAVAATAQVEQEGQALASTSTLPATEKKKSKKLEEVRWRDLPRKDQLTVLVLARLAEPLAQTSMTSYIYFMLQSFDPELPPSSIASQAGLLVGAFTLAQCLTAVWWGKFADLESLGRKRVLLIGLTGMLISTLGVAFSKSFATLLFFRSLGGALNGNVGVMRTMISEIVKEKKYQPKAFLVLPVTFNIGVLIGPVLSGWLQSPVETFPSLFGKDSVFGGKDGVQWMIKYPYALPNLVFANVFILSLALIVFGLEETHLDRRHLPDHGLEIGRAITRFILRIFHHGHSAQYQSLEESTEEIELNHSRAHSRNISLLSTASTTASLNTEKRSRPKLPYRRIFTPNVCFTFLAISLIHIHIATFMNLWYIFLSTPRAPLEAQHLPFWFTGGLGLSPATIGFAIGLIGIIGLSLQFGVYSRVVTRIGVVPTLRLFSLLTFPLVYLLVPFLAIVPSRSAPPHAADGPGIWLAIALLLFVQVIGRTFVLPISQILINNCTPHPSALASVHGLASSISAGSRTLGPVVWARLYGWGLEHGFVALGWWVLGAEAVGASAATWLLREGDGHEIWLEGDEDEG